MLFIFKVLVGVPTCVTVLVFLVYVQNKKGLIIRDLKLLSQGHAY